MEMSGYRCLVCRHGVLSPVLGVRQSVLKRIVLDRSLRYISSELALKFGQAGSRVTHAMIPFHGLSPLSITMKRLYTYYLCVCKRLAREAGQGTVKEV